MTGFCLENKDVITDANYKEVYQTSFRKSSLPNGGMGFPQSSISSSGIINSSDLDNHLTKLLSEMDAVAPSNLPTEKLDPAGVFAKNSSTLRQNIKNEYCFYYKRYTYILHYILMTAATMGSGSTPAAYLEKKQNTERLNSKLNQILQLLQAMVNSRLNSLKQYYGSESGVNELNKQLDTTREELVRHSKLLKNTSLEKDAKAAMIDYSIEKNSSSRNLLAIYGFMNIVAAGLIFYLYRSAKSQ
jgi:hypothetical protein